MSNIKIDTIDLIIIIVYILGILAIGLWTVRKSKMTSDNYFLAGRGLKWLVVGAALFASNISTIHMVGLAAIMSVLAAALNSSATLVSVDIVKRLRPSTTDKGQVLIGRIAAVVIMIIAMLWSTQGGKFTSIFEAINKIAAAMAPPITTVFLLGVFSKRGTKQASIITLCVGFLLGVVSFCLDFVPISGKMYITEGLGIPFMMQAWWLFCINVVIYYIVSYLTPKPDPAVFAECTWKSPLAVITEGKLKGFTDARILAALLLIVMVILYAIFG